MKLINFNIRCCDDPNGHSIKERAPRLQVVLNKYDADVIGFQEVSREWAEIINRDYSHKYNILCKFRSSDSISEALAILWQRDKFELIDSGCFWFSKTPWIESMGADALFHCNRICVWVMLRESSTGKEFCYLNTHFGFGEEYQIESAELIKATTDTLRSGNIIISGDFNTTPNSTIYKLLSEYYTDVNSVTANYTGTTYHEYGRVDNQHIDYCFIKGGIRANEYILIDDKIDGRFPSDHYGILFDLDVTL